MPVESEDFGSLSGTHPFDAGGFRFWKKDADSNVWRTTAVAPSGCPTGRFERSKRRGIGFPEMTHFHDFRASDCSMGLGKIEGVFSSPFFDEGLKIPKEHL